MRTDRKSSVLEWVIDWHTRKRVLLLLDGNLVEKVQTESSEMLELADIRRETFLKPILHVEKKELERASGSWQFKTLVYLPIRRTAI